MDKIKTAICTEVAEKYKQLLERIPIVERFPAYSHCTDDIQITDNRLSNLKFCITGDIWGYERSDIERMIMEHGGKPMSSVSGKTDYLIVGTYIDPKTGLQTTTSKQKKALELIDQGGKIEIISFDRFWDMINGTNI